MNLRWFLSRSARQATEMCRQLTRLVAEQRDLLSEQAIAALTAAVVEARGIARSGSTETIKSEMKKLEEAANKWLKPYPNSGVRENIKEFLVAIVVILSFTTFFLQLTKIPTGSMQPTLYGITSDDLRQDNFEIPPWWQRFVGYWIGGASYAHVVAPYDGEVLAVDAPQTIFPFIKRQRIVFGSELGRKENLYVWLPPDERLVERAQLHRQRLYKKGEDIVKLRWKAGDHLLVDRFTYNFRQPERGEIIVFKTRGIGGLTQDQLYIKRLVALGGETVQIGNDHHLIIDGRKLTASDRHFEFVYTFDHQGKNQRRLGEINRMVDGQQSPERGSHSQYLGHVNGLVGEREFGLANQAPRFPDENTTVRVPKDEYLAMGDNTLNSLDSRYWGGVPKKNVLGRCWFVYWPFTDRFGWGYR